MIELLLWAVGLLVVCCIVGSVQSMRAGMRRFEVEEAAREASKRAGIL